MGRTRDSTLILYFLRHADAGAVGATPAEDDRRELTASDEAELRGASETWRRASVRPGHVAMQLGSLACVKFEASPEPNGGRLAWLLDPHLYLAWFNHEH